MDRNDDRVWYDRGYKLGSVEARRETIIPKLIGAWILLGATYIQPIYAVAGLVVYTLMEARRFYDHDSTATEERERYDPGREYEFTED